MREKLQAAQYQTWFWCLIYLVLFAGLGFFLESCSIHLGAGLSESQSHPKALSAYEQDFVDSWNAWMRQTNSISPASPDYLGQVTETWLQYQVGERFRKFERQLEEHAERERSGLEPLAVGTDRILETFSEEIIQVAND